MPELSKKTLEKRKPIFEAGFLAKNTYARTDILFPVKTDEWDIIEVKSGTRVKPVNYHDLALQKYCYENAGVKINRCFLMHINKKYIQQQEPEPEKLFITEDITENVEICCIGLEK